MRESPVKSTTQIGRFYHVTFQNSGHERGKLPGCNLGMKLKCQIGVKNRLVYQSIATLAIKFATIGI